MRLFRGFFLVFFICAPVSNVFCAFTKVNLSSSDEATWTLQNKNGSIKVPGSVPGGVYSDLMKAGVIGDILARFNDVLTRWVAYDTWTYTGIFNVTQDRLNSIVAHLALHGVDTTAFVEVNGSPVGAPNNMFVRYVFDVKEHLKVGQNEIKLIFPSPVEVARNRSRQHFAPPICVPKEYHGECHANQLRKMQASFSWDWGPAFPSVGLWKPAEIEFYDGAILRTMTTTTNKKGQYWYLKIKTHLESSQKAKSITVHIEANLKVEGGRTIKIARDFHLTTRSDGTTEADLVMVLTENYIRLWWPNGYGEQPLYDLDVVVTSPGLGESSQQHRRVGFRTLELVQVDASTILGNATGGQGLTFHFKVNGYPLFMKGSNWIPSHVLPEYGYNKSTTVDLLSAAKEAHMSMLRVWGGGVYEDEVFYDTCDEYGILIWQDFLFACSMYPADPEYLDNVKTEIEQNVIRLQSHPSIALWSGNNENEAALRDNWYGTSSSFDKYKEEYIKLYVDTIRPIVENLDDNAYIVSSPSNGLKSEIDGYIAKNPYDPHYGDTHYYNYLADNWDMNIYPKTRFASEYGFQSMPSLATMKQATQHPEDFNISSKYAKHRQHSPGGNEFILIQMLVHLKLDNNDPKYFEKFVFYSQISQAMSMKAETEFYRQSQADWYTMGALYWQLNDIWQAPSWSGIEYGGKWKILHYFAKSFFAPVLVSPRTLDSGNVEVYLLNDRFVPIIDAKIIVDMFNWSSLVPIDTKTYVGNALPLSAKKQDIEIDLWKQKTDEVFLRFSIQADGVTSSPYNYVFPKPLYSIQGLRKPNIQIDVSKGSRKNKNEYHYVVNVKADTVILYLWLEAEDLKGRFEDNGFIVTTSTLRTKYISKDQIKPRELQRKITYQYYLN